MSAIKTVAVAGAGNSGSIGITIVHALLKANFAVTILTRSQSEQVFPAEVKIAKVDYLDVKNLTEVLQDQDALICTFGYGALKVQEKLIDAAVAAGVKRILPSEFGPDPEGPARLLPVFGHKVEMETYLKEALQGSSTTYTLVCNNEFLDWDLDHKFNIDLAGRKVEIFDGGDVPFTVTPMTFVAKGVVRVLQLPRETENRIIRLHGFGTTPNKLFEIVKSVAGPEGWTVTKPSTFEAERTAYEALQKDPSHFYGWGVPFIQCSCWGERFGVDFSKNNDNGLLGLQELTTEDIGDLIKSRL